MIRLRRLRLTSKLTLAFVLFAAALLGFIGVLAYYSGRGGLEAATLSELASIATEKQTMLTDWVNARQLDLTAFATSPNNREILAAFFAGSRPGSAEARSAHDRLVGELQADTGKERAFLAMWVMDPGTGEVIAATDPATEGTFNEDRPYFINGKNGIYVQNPYYSLPLQQVTMTVSVPFRAADGQLLAVLAAQVNLDEMNTIITTRTGLQRTDDAFLVNSSYLFVTQPHLLSDPAVLKQGVHTEAVNRCLTRNSGVVFADDYLGIPAIIVYRWLPEREMCLIVKIDQAEAFEPVQAFGVTLTIIGVLALLMGSLLAVRLARTITRPILALQTGVTRFGQGDLDVHLPASSGDELGLLAQAFNTMAATLGEKDRQLRGYADQLEQRIEERTSTLRQSESMYRALLEQASDGVFISDSTGRSVLVNEQACRMLGYSREELLQLSMHDLLVPDALASTPIRFDELRMGKTFLSERHMLRKDGSPVLVEISAKMLTDGRMQGLVRDITERRRVEEALRQSEEKYRELFQNAQAGMYRSRLDGSAMLAINQKLADIFGYSIEEMLAEPATIRWAHPAARTEMANRLRENGLLNDYEVDILTKTGESRTVLASIKLHPQEGFLEGSAVDITERKRAEKTLHRYTERLAAINRLDRIIVSNLEITQFYDSFVTELLALVALDRTAIVVLNEAGDQWQHIRQWTRHEPMILPGEWRPVQGSAIEWVVANRIPLLENELGEGETWLETAPLQHEGLRSRLLLPLIIHERLVGVLTVASHQPDAFSKEDQELLVTIADQLAIAIQNSNLYTQVQRHAAELEQRVLQRTAQLEAANKELEAFSYSVSHDLRAPLRGIDGYARMILRDYASLVPQDGQRRLQALRDMAQHMGKLIDDLLIFSRLNRQSLQKQSVDISKLVKEVLEDLKDEMAPRQVEIVLGELPDCQADRSLLKQVFTNLLSNALKYTRPRALAHLEVGTARSNGALAYFVRDNGVGFDMQYVDKLFGVFQRLHSSDQFEGTGVGLAIVQRIINRHGGRVWAEGALDGGASFYFTLEGDIANDGR